MFCLFLVVVQVFSCTSADCMGVWSHVIYLTRVNSKGSCLSGFLQTFLWTVIFACYFTSPLSPYYKRCKSIHPLFVLYERKVYWFSFKIKMHTVWLIGDASQPIKACFTAYIRTMKRISGCSFWSDDAFTWWDKKEILETAPSQWHVAQCTHQTW